MAELNHHGSRTPGMDNIRSSDLQDQQIRQIIDHGTLSSVEVWRDLDVRTDDLDGCLAVGSRPASNILYRLVPNCCMSLCTEIQLSDQQAEGRDIIRHLLAASITTPQSNGDTSRTSGDNDHGTTPHTGTTGAPLGSYRNMHSTVAGWKADCGAEDFDVDEKDPPSFNTQSTPSTSVTSPVKDPISTPDTSPDNIGSRPYDKTIQPGDSISRSILFMDMGTLELLDLSEVEIVDQEILMEEPDLNFPARTQINNVMRSVHMSWEQKMRSLRNLSKDRWLDYARWTETDFYVVSKLDPVTGKSEGIYIVADVEADRMGLPLQGINEMSRFAWARIGIHFANMGYDKVLVPEDVQQVGPIRLAYVEKCREDGVLRPV